MFLRWSSIIDWFFQQSNFFLVDIDRWHTIGGFLIGKFLCRLFFNRSVLNWWFQKQVGFLNR